MATSYAFTFNLGPLPMRIEGDHPVTRWAMRVYAPLATNAAPQLIFRFVADLPPLPADAVGDADVQVAPGEMRFRERRYDIRISGGDPLLVELRQRDRRPLWLRSLADPEAAYKMWLSHGASLDTHLLKEFAYTIAPLAIHAALLRRDAALIHAGCIAVGDRAVLLPAWGGVGKSTIVSRAVLHGSARFLADDHAVIDAAGLVHPHLLPMHIYHYHTTQDAVLRQRVLAACSPGNRAQWQLASLLRRKRVVRWVSPTDVFGQAKLASPARIEQVILMFRGESRDFSWQEIDPAEAARPCTGVIFEEVNAMPARLALAGAGWASTVLPDLGDAVTHTRNLYTAAFQNARCAKLLVPRGAPPAALLDFLRPRCPLLASL